MTSNARLTSLGRVRIVRAKSKARYVQLMSADTNWAGLTEGDQRWIATQVYQLLPVLKDERRREWANRLIGDLLWFWTADAVDPEGRIKRDAIKHDHRYLHHTKAALLSLTKGPKTKHDKVQHEHAGERAEIIAVLEKHANSVDAVIEILETLNVAVLVTKHEHHALGKRTWPEDWRKRKWREHYDAKEFFVNPPVRKL
jgi:hypothetical protein